MLVVGVVWEWFLIPLPLALLVQCNVQTSNGVSGKLLTTKDLDAYEVFWHTKIVTPSWSSIKMEVSHFCCPHWCFCCCYCCFLC